MGLVEQLVDMGMRHPSGPHHTKVLGWVDSIEDGKWYARLVIDGNDNYIAEMSAPLPPDMGIGNFFSIHRTKRGHTYVYWITKPGVSRSRIKRSRIRAREWVKEMEKWQT